MRSCVIGSIKHGRRLWLLKVSIKGKPKLNVWFESKEEADSVRASLRAGMTLDEAHHHFARRLA